MASARRWDRSVVNRALAALIDAVVLCSEVWVEDRMTWAWLYCSSAWSRTACCWEIWVSRVATWASAELISDCDDDVGDPDEEVEVVADVVDDVVDDAVDEDVGAAPAMPGPRISVPTAQNRERAMT